MTYKTTELLKSELDRELKQVRACVAFNEIPYASLPALDEAISAYLDRVGRAAEVSTARLDASLAHTEVCQAEMEKLQRLIAAACADNRDNWNEIYRLRADLKDSDRERENIHAVLTNTRDELHTTITDRDQLETNNANGCRAIIEMWDDLKALRVELGAARENTRVALAQSQEYQDRMNAVDREFHLLSVANLAAGKELREAQELTLTQALRIDRLKFKLRKARKGSSEARESQPATPTQTRHENASSAISGAKSGCSECEHPGYDWNFHEFCPDCGARNPKN